MIKPTPFLLVFRLEDANPSFVGTIDCFVLSFSYDEGYRSREKSYGLSFSLPLSSRPYAEEQFKPYFEGLLPEAGARKALAANAGLREDDYLGLLRLCGKDCIGDVIVLGADSSDERAVAEALSTLDPDRGYDSITAAEMEEIFSSAPSIANENVESSLSLAGTQSKIGLTHMPEAPLDEGWMRPRGLSASTHILKYGSLEGLLELEYLCMAAAHECGIRSAQTDIIDLPHPVICSERFDRIAEIRNQQLRVRRLHQEDFSQTFGLTSSSKYTELPGGTVKRIAAHLRDYSAQPLKDIRQLAMVLCYCYLIGNCDNHLKNLSVLYAENGRTLRLAPAYDLVGTTYYARFSRNMGMDLGGTRAIDDITPNNLTALASDLGIRPAALRNICDDIAGKVVPALRSEAAKIKKRFPLAPYVVDDLEEDMAPRFEVVNAFVQG